MGLGLAHPNRNQVMRLYFRIRVRVRVRVGVRVTVGVRVS